jgi:hypothetical protein
MDRTARVFWSYCERQSVAFWGEPLNAVTNGAFIIASLWMLSLWLRRDQPRDWPVLWLIALVFTIGIGSFLFHTMPSKATLLADVIPIQLFILTYFFLAMRRYLSLSVWLSLGLVVCFVAAGQMMTLAAHNFMGRRVLTGSVGYVPGLVAMLTVALVVWLRAERWSSRGAARKDKAWGAALSADVPAPYPVDPGKLLSVAQALLLASAVFAISLTFRSIDRLACELVPTGTHFLWHLCNATVLFVLMRAALAFGPGAKAKG